jgi:ribonuclease D
MRAAKEEWIDTNEALAELVDHISKATKNGAITECYIDTEADSLHHYSEKLCLMQLGVAGRIALIDTLALPDITSLLRVIDELTIWLHGADYDLTLFQKTYKWAPRKLRDTQIAARLLGHRELGLGALAERHVGLILSKASQKADWSQRPLPEKMLSYAADDVRYLPEISGILCKMLQESGRTAWFVQSCDALVVDVLARGERMKEEPWRLNGSGKLQPKGLAFLRLAWQWRDGIAAERDVPPFRVINNQDIINLAIQFQEEDRIQLPDRWRSAWKHALLDAADSVQASPPETWPVRPKFQHRRMTEDDKARIDRLCKHRDAKAAGLGIESSALGARALMEELILDGKGAPAARLLPWQREVLGDALEEKSDAPTQNI